MFDRRFFSTQLGRSAILSVAAMVGFIVFAAIIDPVAAPELVFGLPGVQFA